MMILVLLIPGALLWWHALTRQRRFWIAEYVIATALLWFSFEQTIVALINAVS